MEDIITMTLKNAVGDICLIYHHRLMKWNKLWEEWIVSEKKDYQRNAEDIFSTTDTQAALDKLMEE